MAVTAKMYTSAIAKAFNKEIDYDTDTIKVMLLTNAYTPAQTTHDYLDDVVANEVTGTGYTAGGATLASKTVTQSTLTYNFDAADTTWATSTITARYAVVYDASPATNATRPLICYIDFGADTSSMAGDFVIQWALTGIFGITVA